MDKFKKVISIVSLAIVIALVITACGSPDTPKEDLDKEDINADTRFNDGTYTGESEKREFGYELAEVTIEDGKIADIVLKRMTPDGQEVDYNEWTGQDDKPNLKQFKDDMAEKMLSNQTYDVDTISTATETSQGWKEAAKDALEKAK